MCFAVGGGAGGGGGPLVDGLVGEPPFALGTEGLFDDVAHATLAAAEFGDVAGCFDCLAGRIGRADGNAYRPHALHVGQVVAHENHVGGVQSVAGEDLLQYGDLVRDVQMAFGDVEVAEAALERFAPAAGDDEDLVALFQRIADGIGIFGIIGPQVVVVGQRNEGAVGEYAVDVEDEGFDPGYVFFEVSHMLLLKS